MELLLLLLLTDSSRKPSRERSVKDYEDEIRWRQYDEDRKNIDIIEECMKELINLKLDITTGCDLLSEVVIPDSDINFNNYSNLVRSHAAFYPCSGVGEVKDLIPGFILLKRSSGFQLIVIEINESDVLMRKFSLSNANGVRLWSRDYASIVDQLISRISPVTNSGFFLFDISMSVKINLPDFYNDRTNYKRLGAPSAKTIYRQLEHGRLSEARRFVGFTSAWSLIATGVNSYEFNKDFSTCNLIYPDIAAARHTLMYMEHRKKS